MASSLRKALLLSALIACVQSRSLGNDILDRLFKGVGKEDKFTGRWKSSTASCLIIDMISCLQFTQTYDTNCSSCRRGMGFANCWVSWLGQLQVRSRLSTTCLAAIHLLNFARDDLSLLALTSPPLLCRHQADVYHVSPHLTFGQSLSASTVMNIVRGWVLYEQDTCLWLSMRTYIAGLPSAEAGRLG